MTAGCLMALASAMLTGVLLFINGSLVMAVMSAFAASGPSWAAKREFSQFMLFLMPVVLVVIQWMMIEYVRTRFRQRSPD